MHRVRKFLQWIRQFFAPSIPYSLVVNESPENCLQKIQSGLLLRSKEVYSRYGQEPNQFFRITTDKYGDSQFELLVRVDPMMIQLMAIKGRFSLLNSQKTLVIGEYRSWGLWFLLFMIVGLAVTVVAGLNNNDSTAIVVGLIGTLIAIYTNFKWRKGVNLWLTSTLQHVLES
ncbi:MAG: hypothetical protein DPW16_10995 [Chloroflexi bacterium]|nr:hypothetical protein [Chloroflexota bacterium]